MAMGIEKMKCKECCYHAAIRHKDLPQYHGKSAGDFQIRNLTEYVVNGGVTENIRLVNICCWCGVSDKGEQF
jgi:hypothetical protein